MGSNTSSVFKISFIVNEPREPKCDDFCSISSLISESCWFFLLFDDKDGEIGDDIDGWVFFWVGVVIVQRGQAKSRTQKPSCVKQAEMDRIREIDEREIREAAFETVWLTNLVAGTKKPVSLRCKIYTRINSLIHKTATNLLTLEKKGLFLFEM